MTLGDPTALIQFGVLGVILMLLLFGYIWAKPSVDRIIADKEKAEAQRDAMLELQQTQVIPLLTQVVPLLTDVKDKMIPGLVEVSRQVEELRRESQRTS